MAATRRDFPIEIQLKQDMKDAMRSHDQVRLDTLRMALGAIHNLEVARTDVKHADYNKPLTEQDCVDVLEHEAKKRKQAIPLYKQGGREELAAREQRELDILQSYLQASQLSDEDLRAVVQRLIAENGKEFRRVMPLAVKETKGRADGARVQRFVREAIQ